MERRDVRDIEADYAAERKRKAAREKAAKTAAAPERADEPKAPEAAVPAKPEHQTKAKAKGDKGA